MFRSKSKTFSYNLGKNVIGTKAISGEWERNNFLVLSKGHLPHLPCKGVHRSHSYPYTKLKIQPIPFKISAWFLFKIVLKSRRFQPYKILCYNTTKKKYVNRLNSLIKLNWQKAIAMLAMYMGSSEKNKRTPRPQPSD